MSRSERRARTEAVVSRRSRDWRVLIGSEIDEYRRGRSKDRSPLDCGHTRCGICHGDKLSGHPPIHDLRQL